MVSLQSLGGGIALVFGIVAILRRNCAIGGWLFYFFCQVLLGLALAAASTHWGNYSPDQWDTPLRYFLFAVSNLSRIVLLAAISVVCILMADTRAWHWVVALQYALAAYGVLTVVKLPVDAYCFPSATARDALSLAFPAVWMVYFGVSVRVKKVFGNAT
ncbi:MAG TPA: hypothetical protein VHW09_00630 [Bryobacteraceae bacterium]|nr:hypothetical protein [Bryobacteraceae bacterium]